MTHYMVTKMDTPSFYTMERISKYMVKIEGYNNIEDCPDVFYTWEEIKEMLNVDYLSTGYRHDLNSMKVDLAALYQKAKDEGKKSFILDNDLLEAITGHCYLSDLIDFCQRRGNKVYLKDEATTIAKQEKKKYKEKTTNSLKSLVWKAQCAFNRNRQFQLDVQYVNLDPKGALMFIKPFVTFDDLVFSKHETDDVEYFRKLWNEVETVEF